MLKYCARHFGEGWVEDWRDGKLFGTRELNPRLDLMNHSPTGFAWGYNGSGPSQFALAILADVFRYTSDTALRTLPELADERARYFYQRFKLKMITARAQDHRFELSEDRICAALHELTAEEASINAPRLSESALATPLVKRALADSHMEGPAGETVPLLASQAVKRKKATKK